MSIPNTIPLSGLLATNAYTDNYAIIDPIFGIGGLREVPLQIDRDTIPPGKQRVGMLVYVQGSGSYFQLISTGSSILNTVTNSYTVGASQYLTNANWTQLQFTPSGSTNYVLNSQTSSMTVLSSSYAATASYVVSASYAISAAYAPSAPVNYGFTSSYLTTSSYQIDSSSFSASIAALNNDISVLNGEVSVLESVTASYVTTSSLNLFTSSYKIDSSSFSASIAYLGSQVGGSGVSVATFNAFTSSYQIDSASIVSDIIYSNSTPTTATVGGISAGSTFTSESLTQILNALLYPYQSPAFTSFAISGQAQTLEVGNGTNGGATTFTFGTSNSGNVKPNSIIIKNVTGATTLGSGLPNSSPFTTSLLAVSESSRNATYQWSIGGVNTNNVSMSVDNFTVSWQSLKYVGSIPYSSLTALQAASSSTQLAAVSGITFTVNSLDGNSRPTGTTNFDFTNGTSYPSPGGIAFWLYANAMGTTSFTQGGFTYPTSLTTTSGWVNTNSINVGNYYLYVSSNPTQGTFTVVAS